MSPAGTRRAPGPPLHLLDPLGHPGRARLRLPRRCPRLGQARHPAPDGLIPLTCNEIQRLFITLAVRPVHEVAHWLAWSAWRRRHQARAQASHYRRQAANQA